MQSRSGSFFLTVAGSKCVVPWICLPLPLSVSLPSRAGSPFRVTELPPRSPRGSRPASSKHTLDVPLPRLHATLRHPARGDGAQRVYLSLQLFIQAGRATCSDEGQRVPRAGAATYVRSTLPLCACVAVWASFVSTSRICAPTRVGLVELFGLLGFTLVSVEQTSAAVAICRPQPMP